MQNGRLSRKKDGRTVPTESRHRSSSSRGRDACVTQLLLNNFSSRNGSLLDFSQANEEIVSVCSTPMVANTRSLSRCPFLFYICSLTAMSTSRVLLCWNFQLGKFSRESANAWGASDHLCPAAQMASIVKEYGSIFVLVLTSNFNDCLNNSTFQRVWETARIFPVFESAAKNGYSKLSADFSSTRRFQAFQISYTYTAYCCSV